MSRKQEMSGGNMNAHAKNLAVVIVAALLILVGAPALFAATQNAVLYGTVYDAAGNPAAGVTVALDNPAIGFARTTSTDTDGSYNFAEVPPAENYDLSATRAGRKIDLRTGITVNVGDERVGRGRCQRQHFLDHELRFWTRDEHGR